MRARVRRLFVFIVVSGLIALLVALWLRPARPQHAVAAAGVAVATPAAASARPASGHTTTLFAWLGQRGVAGRGIAGRVVHAGQPVAKASVRLTTEELHVGEWSLAQVETDDAGHFDLGPRPATRYRVVAQADGLVAASAIADLRALDPRPAPDALTIELRDCEVVVSGTVRDAGGGVIVGAQVRAGTYASNFSTTMSDAEGRYRLCVSTGPTHIEAGADGYGTVLQHTRAQREVRLDFALWPEVVIAGHVVDGEGAPVGGAVVVAATNGHDPGSVAESAADGAFRLNGLVAGTYLVIARSDDRAAEKSLNLEAGPATADLVLTLEQRMPLTGRVMAGGQPAGGATVVVTSSDGPWKLGSAVSQADGRFSIAVLPPHEVKVSVEGHKLVSPDASLDLAVVHDVELVCERLATVSGRVLCEGKPVGRAEVHLYSVGRRPYRVTAHDDGTFEIEGVVAGSYQIYAESTAKGAFMARRALEVGARDMGGLVLELDLAASIAGVVVDATGAPAATVAVHFVSPGDEGSDVTSADGTFLVTALAGGRDYQLYVTSWPGENLQYRPPAGRRFPVVHVADGTTRVTGVRIAIVRGNLSISGHVLRRGEPMAGVGVVAGSETVQTRAQTSADGSFVLPELVAGTYQLFAERRSGGVSPTVTAQAGATDVRIEIPPGGAIEGVLRGFGVAPQVWVRATGERGMMYAPEVTGAKFSIADITAGTYDVHAVGANGAHGTARVFVATDEIAHVTVEAGATAKVTGVVTDWRTGAPIAGAYCAWAIDGLNTNQQVTSDDRGAFVLGVPAGPIRIDCHLVSALSAPAHEVTVDLAAGAWAQVAVELIVLRPGRYAIMGVSIVGRAPDPMRILNVGPSAAASGLRAGDAVVAIDGRSVVGLDFRAVSLLMADRDATATARITVDRDGAELTFDVAPEAQSRPDGQ